MKNYSYIGISFIILVFGIWVVNEYEQRAQNKELLTFEKVPPFSFVNQEGDTISNDTYAGKVHVVEFFFTNGRAENGVQAFQNMARRMRVAIESHIGCRIPHKHPVLMWLIEWVGGAHNRFKDGRDDGQTPRERAGW